MNFLKDGLSIEESKISALILLCVGVTVFGLVMYKFNGDISDNLTEIIKVFVLSIAGVNGVNAISKLLGNKNNYDDYYKG